MMADGRLRRVTAHDLPNPPRPAIWPGQVIYRHDRDGYKYLDPNSPKDNPQAAMTVAWFGWTTEPLPRQLRRP